MFVTLTFLICVSWSVLSHAQNEYDVIIMGAGAAGISAAKTLYDANITNILIIEAQWFIGGRTVVHNFADYMLNIGASYISGACITPTDCSDYTEVNPMLTAAYKYNISFVISDTYSDGIILDFGGNEHNRTNFYETSDKFYEAHDCAMQFDDMSVFAALHLCGWGKPQSAMDKTVQWFNVDWNGEHAKWTNLADGHGIGTYNTYGPDDVFITDSRGYQGLISLIANEFLDIDNIDNEDKIILNSPINTIKYDENGVSVILDNTTEYFAQYGIVTFSLGVLQSDIVEFIPQLPSWKKDSLLAFDFVDSAIIYIKWPYNFWNDTVIAGYPSMLLNDDRSGFFTCIYNLDHIYPQFNNSLIWRIEVALDLANLVQNQNFNETIKLLIDSKLSHYFDNIPTPDDIFVSLWNKNKYVQGSYSNWPVGFSHDNKEAMTSRLQRLFFAGEAFDDFDHGFVHNAYLNGNHTANKILSCMGHDNEFECPTQYIPPHDDCKSADSVLKDFIWLWIILGVVFGIILGYLSIYLLRKIDKNKDLDDSNYGSVDMVIAQNTDTNQ